MASKSYYKDNSYIIGLKVAAKAYNIHIDRVKEIRENPCESCGFFGEDRGTIHIDHCHDTGKVRGGLCHNCNTALGLLGDSLELIDKLRRYLSVHK
jgi:hypothetical protein